MTPDVDQTIVLSFADGDAVCPRWWGTLAPFRQGPEHGGMRPRLPFTREEAPQIVNKALEQNLWSKIMHDTISGHIRQRGGW